MTALTQFLNEIEERMKRATPGPWRARYERVMKVDLSDENIISVPLESDAKFIAHSRTDLERLLSIVKEQEHALAWYADKDNWSVVEDYDGYLNYGLITYGDIEESKYEGGFDAGGIRARAAQSRVAAIAKGGPVSGTK